MASLVGGGVATLAAVALLALLRWTLQVRTLPERLLEWVLLVVPPGLFEAALQRFGFDTKRYALYLASAVAILVLFASGTVVLARASSSHSILSLGIGLWLLVMLVVMPLTGAGWFATSLGDGAWPAILGYLAVSLTYAAVLAAGRLLLHKTYATPGAAANPVSRRTALVATAAAVVTLLGTYLVQLVGLRPDLTEVRVLDPQEPVPSGGLDGQAAHPESVAAEQPEASSPTPVPSPAGAPSPADAFAEPRPARPMKRDKDGAVLPSGRRAGELTDLITSNDDFYVVTKNAAGDPVLDARRWRLRIDGDVQRPIELDYASLRNLPAAEITRTLECISNLAAHCELAAFGCDLISNARWRGVPVRSLLDLAGGVQTDVSYVAAMSADEYTSALPLEAINDPEALLVYEMNGEVLPREHGYPVRLLVPDRYGMKNAKWVIGLRPMKREFLDWYGQRSWSKDGVVKTMCRIDLPPRDSSLKPGEYNVAGIAYAGDRGIDRVEYSLDSGSTWQPASFLDPPAGRETWVRWIGRFQLEPDASLTLTARAIDGTGAVQPEPFVLPQPDGSSGWPSIEVRAG